VKTVSVLMAVHNGARFLESSVASVTNQSLGDWELVIVDDGSTDATPDIISGLHDPRIRHIRLPSRSGLPAALNRGLAACSGELVARFDGDDLCMQTRLEEQVAELAERPTVGVLGTWARVIDEDGNPLGALETPVGPANVYRRLRWRNALIHPSVVFRRELVLRAGGYDERALRFQDYDLWLRMAALTELDNMARTLVAYRVHPSQQSHAKVSFGETRFVGKARRGLARENGEPGGAAIARQVVWWGGQLANNRRKNRSRIILRSVSRPQSKVR
jgi:glycosyltransferase involved in cell wall biosynthesis